MSPKSILQWLSWAHTAVEQHSTETYSFKVCWPYGQIRYLFKNPAGGNTDMDQPFGYSYSEPTYTYPPPPQYRKNVQISFIKFYHMVTK